jgi:hypothetical protein
LADIDNGMSQINPFAGAIAQTPQAARLAQIDRDEQIRKALERSRATGLTDQRTDEYVESADAVESVGDDDRHREEMQRRKRRQRSAEADPPSEEDKPRLDIRA